MEHITQAQLQLAIDGWNQFNRELANNGMRLCYECTLGTFYVCSSTLCAAESTDVGAIAHNDYINIIEHGGFGDDAVNNPPWFTDDHEYTLKQGLNYD